MTLTIHHQDGDVGEVENVGKVEKVGMWPVQVHSLQNSEVVRTIGAVIPLELPENLSINKSMSIIKSIKSQDLAIRKVGISTSGVISGYFVTTLG